jgi:Cytochrome c554 and c-prime
MMSNNANAADAKAAAKWSSVLVTMVMGMLTFETLTGLSIYFLPFSVPNQIMVLLHTLVGVVFLVPATIYSTKHWARYQGSAMSHYKLTGYVSVAVLAVCSVSGVVVGYQALLATKMSTTWDLIHVVSTFLVIAAAGAHIILLLVRKVADQVEQARQEKSAQRQFVFRMTSSVIVGAILVAAGMAALPSPGLVDEFPEDYVYAYGDDRPFAPSLANTESGGALDERRLSQSESCGSSGCHEEIYKEWSVSAHRYSAMDPAFQAIQSVMAEQNGAESTRYCGGCHDPISLFAGTKNVFNDELTSMVGYQEGVSCIVCHAVKETDQKGNAAFVVGPPDRYIGEFSYGSIGKPVADFLIRAYPKHHVESLGKTLFKTPEYCAACHKQFIDEEVNNVGWVQLQNQFDNWRKSHWNTPNDPTKTIECRECHMPLQDSNDPASGDAYDYNRSVADGKSRSHRFLGANQLIPALLQLEGYEEHLNLTEKWLRGEIEIPEIADKWADGSAVGLTLELPETVMPGEEVPIKVVVTSNKVGHDFPTGPLDIIQTWIELTVTDQSGETVYVSGHVEDTNFIQQGAFMFKAEPVDQYGNLIDRHNLWEMVGVRYRRSLFPGFSDAANYNFACPTVLPTVEGEEVAEPGERIEEFAIPAGMEGVLTVAARLRYRKIDQYLLNFIYGDDTELTSPITDLSETQATIQVVSSR